MKLAIFGASGKTGHELVNQALAAGHSVRALVRDPARMRLHHPDLTVIRGDALDAASVASTIEGADVVLSALGMGASNPPGHITRAVSQIVAAMQKTGALRLIAMSSMGVNESRSQAPLSFRLVMLTVPIIRETMADLGQMENLLRGTDLEWVIVRPGGLEDKPPRHAWQVSTGRDLKAAMIPRADVAAFMLQQLTSSTYVRQAVGLT